MSGWLRSAAMAAVSTTIAAQALHHDRYNDVNAVAVDQTLLAARPRSRLVVHHQGADGTVAQDGINQRRTRQRGGEQRLVLGGIRIGKSCRFALEPHGVSRVVLLRGHCPQCLVERDGRRASRKGLGAIVVIESEVGDLLPQPFLVFVERSEVGGLNGVLMVAGLGHPLAE